MSVFYYKLEFLYDDTAPSDDGVYIHMRDNPPIYKEHTTKEDYDVLGDDEKNAFLTELFTVAGVVEVSTKAYRIWLMKSPVYTWEEVLAPIIYYLMTFYGDDSSDSLPGSGQIDGRGVRLNAPVNRRKI